MLSPFHAGCPKEPEDEPSNNAANDPQNNVENNPSTGFFTIWNPAIRPRTIQATIHMRFSSLGVALVTSQQDDLLEPITVTMPTMLRKLPNLAIVVKCPEIQCR